MPTPPPSPWTRPFLSRLCLSLLRLVRRERPAVAIPSCYALLQISADPAKCDQCGDCARVCPMNIDLPAQIASHERIESTDCILCQTCVNTCPQHALTVTSTLDRPRKSRR